MKIDQLEQSITDDAIMIGDVKVCAGVMVTAGREWIQQKILGDKSRFESSSYIPIDPSPQLFTCNEITAGSERGIWTKSANEKFNIAVPDKIPDKTTFEIPAKNIAGEQILVAIYVSFCSLVFVELNYLYEIADQHDGTQVWKLINKWQNMKNNYIDPEGQSNITMR